MATIYMYADETGNLDYAPAGKVGATEYFGFGTAVFPDAHGDHLFQGLELRAKLEASGVRLPKGFHAADDALQTKNEMYGLIRQQAPRFDSTFLLKANAYDAVKAKGEMYLYKMAWFLHFKEVAHYVCRPGDELRVVVGTIGTAARRTLAREALDDVCSQVNRKISLCYWDASTCWGLQVADYGLWAIQRNLVEKRCTWFEPCVRPTMASRFLPWGKVVPAIPA